MTRAPKATPSCPSPGRELPLGEAVGPTSVSEFEVEPGSDDAGIIADEVGRVAEVQVFNAPRHGLVDLAFDTHPTDETGVGFRYAYTIPEGVTDVGLRVHDGDAGG